jgi:protocatechuate 3,4-dioxygenase beta subunit
VAVTVWSACVISMALFVGSPGALATPDRASGKCVFEGAAHDRVTLLPLSRVSLRLIAVSGALGYTGSTQRDGSFHFENVEPGDYRVEARRAGYSSPSVMTDKDGHAISTLRLKPGDVHTGNKLTFTPDGSLAGMVNGQDGEALPNAVLTLIALRWQQGAREYKGVDVVAADEAGVFHFASVAPGRYWLHAARPMGGPLQSTLRESAEGPDLRIAGRYYPNAANLDDARAIEVHAGEAVSEIDFKLPLAPARHVSGTYAGGSEHVQIVLQARRGNQTLFWDRETATPGGDGKFDLAGIVPGDYDLAAAEGAGPKRVGSVRLPLTVAAERDLTGVSAAAVTRIEVKGRIRVDGDAPRENLPVIIFCDWLPPAADTSMACRTQPESDGSFTIRDLPPGRYSFGIDVLETKADDGYYLKEIRLNGAPVPDVYLTSGPANLELILSPTVAALEGRVIPQDEPGELSVVMVPEKLSSGSTKPLRVFLDPQREFHEADLEPGTYRVFAVPECDWGLWQNSEFLRQIAAKGITVEVSGKPAAAVQIHALRAEDIRQAEAKIE